jgi:methionyl-tRNA synthetase
MGRGGKLFLPPVSLSGQTSEALCRRSRFRFAEERLNEVASFVQGGLKDLSISRTTFDWGIKVPANPKHVMYVWVDALTNYITGVGFPDREREVQALLAGGTACHRQGHRALPRGLLAGVPDVGRHCQCRSEFSAHGFLFNRGEKMSKSVGNVIDPFALADAYGVDPLRYFFLREVPFGQDGNYSHEAIVNRINADLGQRPRQSGAALALDGGQSLWRRFAGAWRIERGGQDHSRRR